MASNTNLTKKDFEETKIVADIIKQLDKADAMYADAESDKIYEQQPFIISLILGYRLDLNKNELDQIVKMFFVIWKYFKGRNKFQRKKITEQQYDRILKKNMDLLKFSEREKDQEKKLALFNAELSNLEAKALLAAIPLIFDTQPALKNMQTNLKARISLGMLSIIECFEEMEKE